MPTPIKKCCDLMCYPITQLKNQVKLARVTYDINGTRYYMEHLLGEGGFSFVYKVTDSSGRGFALKKILAQSEELLEGGIREIDVLREFGGRRHILSLVDSCVKEIRPGVKELLLVLPCFERGTVEDALTAKTVHRPQGGIEGGVPPELFSEPDALGIFIGICRGLLEFHGHKPEALAHYDIKPGNVLLADDGSPTLMDFGSVRPAKRKIKSRREALELQEFASINCTMPYRAPELWEPPSQCETDERVDAWSAGCVLFALFYGHSPFELAVAEMGGSLAVAVMSGRVKFPTNSTLSDECKHLINDMIEVDMSQRITTDTALDRAVSQRNKIRGGAMP